MLQEIRVCLVTCLSALSLTACQNTNSVAPSPTKINTDILDTTLSKLVTEGSVVGVSALIYSDNQEIYYGDFGDADREADKSWQRDTLATIYSMTKPVAGVILMSLYEEGLFDMDAPLSDYLPEYEEVKVFAGVRDDGLLILETPRRPIKVIDIFRHTACFGYGWGDDPVSALMNEAQIMDPSKPLSQFSEELAELPLYCHPGEAWKYSVAVDVQARLAEVITGKPFDQLVQERVLGPLKMTDTSYFVPSDKKSRVAAIYAKGPDGSLTRVPDTEVYSFRKEKPVQINGGFGLTSSIDDYMRFALMLQNEGSYDGVQILEPETVAFMAEDHLPPGLTDKDFLPSKGQMGFGLNFAVRLAPPASDAEPFGAEGEFFWDGAASTLFWVDPKNDITAVFFIQVFPFDGTSQAKFRRAVYEALDLEGAE